MRTVRVAAAAVLLLASSGILAAQVTDLRSQLERRGLPPELVVQVAAIADDAAGRGLPVEPIADKAIEGWAKRVPAPRLVEAVRQTAARLGTARGALVAQGLSDPPGAVVAAAAEALGRGMTPADVAAVIEAAPAPEAAASGLTVAAALAAQGLGRGDAGGAVAEAFRRGRSLGEVLELPSVAQALMAQGVPIPEVARRLLGGGPFPGPAGAGPPGARPTGVPPALGPPFDAPPGKKRSGGS